MSISSSLLAPTTRDFRPIAATASSKSFARRLLWTLFYSSENNRRACRKKLHQQAEPLSGEFAAHQVYARDVRAGLIRLAIIPSLTESPATKVMGIDVVTDFGLEPKVRHRPPQGSEAAVSSPANFLSWSYCPLAQRYRSLLSCHRHTEGLKPPQKSIQMGLRVLRRPAAEKADHWHRLLLSTRDCRPSHGARTNPINSRRLMPRPCDRPVLAAGRQHNVKRHRSVKPAPRKSPECITFV